MPPSARIDAIASRSALVADALGLAREAHAGQIRNGSGGMPYIEHPIAVAELLAEQGFAEPVLAAALLHDVVEDTDVTIAELRERFGETVAALVAALTDREEIDAYEARKGEHRRRVAAAGEDALAIYAADKLSNARSLRRAYATQGEAVADELKVPLDVKLAVWEADLALLEQEAPRLPFPAALAAELSALREARASARPRARD